MFESRLSYSVDPLRELSYSRAMILGRAREDGGMKFISMDCDLLPNEIFAAAGVIPLVSEFTGGGDDDRELFDFKLKYGSDPRESADGIILFSPQSGWADYAYPGLRIGYESLLKKITGAGFEGIGAAELKRCAQNYNSMRRAVRAIRAARKNNPSLLSNEDLFAIYSSSASLPPETVIPYLENIFALMTADKSAAPVFKGSALVSAGFISEPAILDAFEEAGILAAEDHSCLGGRQFDISYNPDAPDLVAEIIYSFSFKLYCHAVRTIQERYDLLYKMLKGYGIDCAVLITGGARHALTVDDANFLRKKLMRHGVDPVVCGWDSAVEAVKYYATYCDARLGE